MTTNCTRTSDQAVAMLFAGCFLLTACLKQSDGSTGNLDSLGVGQQLLAKKDYQTAEKSLLLAEKELEGKRNNESRLLQALVALSQSQKQQRKFKEAESTLLKACSLSQRINGPKSADTGDILSQLGATYFAERKFKESQKSWQESLEIAQQAEKPDETKEEAAINGVIAASCAQGMCTDNEALMKRLLELRRKNLGNEHPFTLISMNLLAELYDHKKNYAAAKPLYVQVYDITKKNSSEDLPAAMVNLARIERREKHYKKAEDLLNEALVLESKDKTYGSMGHPSLFATLDSFVFLYKDQGNWNKALEYSEKALAQREKIMGKNHPQIPPNLKSHAEILRKMHRNSEAKNLEDRARKIELGG